ncbi:diguanylate cyclase (GGDEF)-like protein [Granulicella aggregans]|uniref:Diguanylate cyclase (GGDEF)-like protein n=1 Tax=Granulicella aggregans TaxID=474949 RepID=A0A7W7ZH53_9BACT|nr:diguanylate cyclase (GGDEF)-like protein [Granulicella aggregans]
MRLLLASSLALMIWFSPASLSSFGQEVVSDPTILLAAAQVHSRPADAPVAKVHLSGMITYYDPSDGVMFFQDESGGVYINTSKTYPVRTGDSVTLDGFTHGSFRTEMALDPVITVTGRGKSYPAPELSYSKLAAGDGDCLLVTFRGIVRAQDIETHEISLHPGPSVHLDVAMAGGEVEVYLDPSFGNNPESLLDATVEMTGVAGGAFDAKNQLTGLMLYIPSADSIKVLKPPAKKLEDLALTDIDEVFPSRKVDDTSNRLRVRGTVTFYKKGDSAVLEHQGKSIYVQTRQTSPLAVGDVVDAFGFASDREYAPSLVEASIIKTGFSEKLTPQTVTYSQAFGGFFSDNLISMSGKVVSQLQGASSETLVVDVDGHLVSAILENGRLPTFLQGSRVQVTGICRIVAGGPFRNPNLFRIEMRSGADALLVAQPSWWTVRHLLELLAVFLGVAILIAGWALLLRQRLVVQTNRIQRSMSIARERSRILEKINSCATPDALLTVICDTVVSLLPGVECAYLFNEKGSDRPAQAINMTNPAKQLYKMDLHGSEGEVLGWIVVSERDGYVPSSDRHEVFDMLFEIAKLAVNQLLLHRALVHHSTHDALTDLPNRRLCDRRFEDALEEARLNSSRVAVIYIDVDRFKEVNDQYGHRIGDIYLQQISARLLAAKRQSDTLARIGGDEFLLIMPSDSSYENSETVLSRLEKCFDHPFSIEGRLVVGSASLGFARYPDHGQTTEELKLHADHQMYASKRKRTATVLMVESRSA